MAVLSQIKAWWSGSRVPTVIQRQETFDSFRHKDDKVAIGDVTDLSSAMNAKADLGEDGKVLPEQLPDTSSLGNWGVDINGWLTSSESASGIVTPAWTIDEYGNFTGTSAFANNAGHADYADSLGYMWFDNGSELYSVDGRGISTPNWNIDSEGNINGVFWNINNGFFSGTANMAASLYGEWFPDENYNLSTGTNVRGINTGMWNITPEGLFSGNAANANQAVNASFLNDTWFDNGEYLNAFSEGVGHLPRGINTLNWNINASGNAFLNELHLRDLANAPTDFGYVFLADGGLNCFDINDWRVFGIQGDNISMGDSGNGGAWAIYKPYGLATGSSVGCWMPNVNAKTLAVSVNNNFADEYGNIIKFLKSLTTTQINALTGQDADTGVMYYNTTLDCPVFKSAAGWRKFSHTAM